MKKIYTFELQKEDYEVFLEEFGALDDVDLSDEDAVEKLVEQILYDADFYELRDEDEVLTMRKEVKII